MELSLPAPIETMNALLQQNERILYPNADSQHSYAKNWILYVQNNGLDQTALEYLYSGSKLQSGCAFVKFWETQARPAQLIQKLIEFARPDQEGAGRLNYLAVQFSVLGNLLSAGAPADQLRALISSLEKLARKSKGGYNHNAGIRIREDFLPYIILSAVLPPYSSLGLPEKVQSGFAEMLISLTKNTSAKRWTKDRLAARDKICTWVSANEADGLEATFSVRDTDEISKPENTLPVGPSGSGVSTRDSSFQSRSADLASAVKVLQELVPYVASLEETAAVQKRELAELKSAAPATEMITRITELEQQLKEKSTLIDVIQQDNKASFSEHTEQLEEKLAREYEDFCSAESLAMSVMLGENLRDQLRQVFAALHDYGLKF